MSNKTDHSAMPCLVDTWHITESELFHWLIKQSNDVELSFDVLQDTFLRALQQQDKFCDIQNQRAWLYRVARNLLMDENRKSHKVLKSLGLDDEPAWDNEPVWDNEKGSAVDSLAQCLPKALEQLSSADRQIIEQCDLNGQIQQDFALAHGLTLVATKSRIQRARKKLRDVLKTQCQIRFDEQQNVCCFYAEQTPEQ